jgi:hypothetical protein
MNGMSGMMGKLSWYSQRESSSRKEGKGGRVRVFSDGPRKGWIILIPPTPLPLFSCWLHCSRHTTHLAHEVEWGSSHQPMSKRNLG